MRDKSKKVRDKSKKVRAKSQKIKKRGIMRFIKMWDLYSEAIRMKKAKVIELSLENLIDRQDFLIVQGNDLAKSLGGLKSFELRVLDYCFRFILYI